MEFGHLSPWSGPLFPYVYHSVQEANIILLFGTWWDTARKGDITVGQERARNLCADSQPLMSSNSPEAAYTSPAMLKYDCFSPFSQLLRYAPCYMLWPLGHWYYVISWHLVMTLCSSFIWLANAYCVFQLLILFIIFVIIQSNTRWTLYNIYLTLYTYLHLISMVNS